MKSSLWLIAFSMCIFQLAYPAEPASGIDPLPQSVSERNQHTKISPIKKHLKKICGGALIAIGVILGTKKLWPSYHQPVVPFGVLASGSKVAAPQSTPLVAPTVIASNASGDLPPVVPSPRIEPQPKIPQTAIEQLIATANRRGRGNNIESSQLLDSTPPKGDDAETSDDDSDGDDDKSSGIRNLSASLKRYQSTNNPDYLKYIAQCHPTCILAIVRPENEGLAEKFDQSKLIQSLVENKANINCYDAEGSTPLDKAVQTGQLSWITILMQHKAIMSNDEHPVCWWINNHGHPVHKNMIATQTREFISLFTPQELNTPYDEKTRNTFLHLAAGSNASAIAMSLIGHQADPMLQNERKQTPLQIANASGFKSCVQAMQEASNARHHKRLLEQRK